jgi:glycosyltransferase involved in cell wall biosynthesis
MDTNSEILVALPIMAESEWLPATLDCITRQKFQNFHIVACVNQPESYWNNKDKKYICVDNARCLDILANYDKKKTTVINHSSKNKGWTKKSGIGFARKVIMDHIASQAKENDIILSLDADTTFDENYFSSVIDIFARFPDAAALSIPYYHKLTASEKEDRAILRYEIYMRNYAINLLNISSPYAFTALGSAIALPVSAYKAIGGMTPKHSGEDFYFLQKLKKYGRIIIHNTEKVFPATRFSDRVFFGTGPAMIKGDAGDWSSYPVYHHSLFADIKKTQDAYAVLFNKTIEVPLSKFLEEQFAEKDIWQPLRKNFRTEENFIRACHEKLDGLRILQYLKQNQPGLAMTDENCLNENIEKVFNNVVPFISESDNKNIDFMRSSVTELDAIRNYLVATEEVLQKNIALL